MFLAFGAKRRAIELDKEGKPTEKKYIDYKVVTDERICDGLYYARSMRLFRRILENPAVLEERLEVVEKDID